MSLKRNVGLEHYMWNLIFKSASMFSFFVFQIKGFPSEGLQKECDKMLESIGLVEKRNNLSGALSGGMKRKLSLGMALIGGSKVNRMNLCFFNKELFKIPLLII